MGKYFTVNELCKSDTARVKGIDNTPNATQISNMEELIKNVLDPLREAYGKPINVNSGFRCTALNKVVGGVSSSQHVEGKAADISSNNKGDNAIIFELVKSLKLPFDQLIWEKGNNHYPDWIHISYNKFNTRQQILKL